MTETGGTNDRYTKLKADSETTIDVIELSQAMAAKGAEEGLFELIDLSKIEHASDLIAAARRWLTMVRVSLLLLTVLGLCIIRKQ